MANRVKRSSAKPWRRAMAKAVLAVTVAGALGAISNTARSSTEQCEWEYNQCSNNCQANHYNCMSGFNGCDPARAEGLWACNGDYTTCHQVCEGNPETYTQCEHACSSNAHDCRSAVERTYGGCSGECDWSLGRCD